MGRSGGNNGGGNGGVLGGAGGGRNPLVTKLVAGVAAVAVAFACSALGVQVTSSGSSSSNDAQVTASQTVSDASGSLTFRNEERLREHFEKHGAEMGFTSAEAYLAAANKVVANPAALHKTEAADGDDAYFLESTGEFVVVSQKGYIRTYFLTDKDYFERQ